MMLRKVDSRGKRIALWIITLGILLPGAYGFVQKMEYFIRSMAENRDAGFTIIPISNYFLIAAGMGCLLVWAIANGMFRDIEAPKYTMLEREDELDRREELSK